MARAYIGVASNLAPERNIPEALAQLAGRTALEGISMFYRTPAIARPEQPDYFNGVVAVETGLAPRALKFDVLRPIEAALGRTRGGDPYSARAIDLDLLLHGAHVIDEPGLRLPDPDLRSRGFLAAALYGLAPDIVLPDTGAPLREFVPERGSLQSLDAFTTALRARWRL